ncbi:serine threonine- kinase 32C [Labeo rohita]|uniref:Serine threonine-kinase 32C n=1 Tax=Labeo rohita TaxID=84645 RepID=A0A498MK75_LABRO|nr:serine threonine- kinase 32C [Labeo rohita]
MLADGMLSVVAMIASDQQSPAQRSGSSAFVRDARVLEASSSISFRRAERNEIRASMFHWGKWKKRMGANSSSKRPVFDDKEDGEDLTARHHTAVYSTHNMCSASDS